MLLYRCNNLCLGKSCLFHRLNKIKKLFKFYPVRSLGEVTLSLVEAAVQATLRNVTRIKDINYTINQTADLNTIDAEIVFYEGQSLID